MASYNETKAPNNIRSYYRDPNVPKYNPVELSNGTIGYQDASNGDIYREDGTYANPIEGELGYYDRSSMPFDFSSNKNFFDEVELNNGDKAYQDKYGIVYLNDGTTVDPSNGRVGTYNINEMPFSFGNKTKYIPSSYKAPTLKDITTAIQQSIYDGTNIGKNYGEGFVDGKYGNSTASAMIDTLNQFFDANLSNDGTTYDKTRRIQTWLKSNGFKGADGNDLVLDGKFGKNTAEAFSRAYLKFKEQMIKGAEFARQAEEREAAQLAAQQAAEAQAAAQQEAYRNSPAVRAEMPNYNMFSGVNLPYGLPETREDDYGPVDIFGRRI